MKKDTKREGFTLVELLIVIVVIGVLSAMMMLSSTEAVSSAKAADIVSDLRNLKTAALAFYADNLASADKDGFSLSGTDEAKYRTAILKYMNNGDADAHYKFVGTNQPDTWYVYYDTGVDGNQVTPTVSKKLESRAKSTGLLKEDKSSSYVGVDTGTPSDVYMFIR